MPDPAAASHHILVVDDDDAILDLLRLLLESEGYAVTTAASFQQARAAIAAKRFDLVLSDVRLPDAAPFVLLDQLAADPATAALPVLVCSGAVREIEQAAERLAHIESAVLLKPFDIDDLLASVSRLLAPVVDAD